MHTIVAKTLVVIGGLAAVVVYLLTWNTQDIQVSDPEVQRVVQRVRNRFMDRCAPASCIDYLQITKIERLDKSIIMTNTGGGGKSTSPRIGGDWLGIIESLKTRLISDIEYKEYTCRAEDYLLHVTQRGWHNFPIDRLRLCYQAYRPEEIF